MNTVRSVAGRVRQILLTPYVAWALFLAVVAGVIWWHLPSLGQPLLEHHSFRQTQTAWTALIFHQQGIDLLHPMVPVFGPPFVLPFEFPLFQALAALVMDAGVAPDVAMRATGLATFLLAAFVLWRLVARLAGEAAALISVLALAVCALGLLWSRTSMIEYLVVAASLALLYGALRWHESRHWAWWALALGAGVVAMLIKPTTAVMYLPAVLALGWTGWRAGAQRPLGRPLPYAAALLALIVVPLAFGLAWTAYADGIKAASQFSADQTSAALFTWNYGTIAQRFSFDTWKLIFDRMEELVLGGATLIWVPLAFVACFWLKRRLFTIALSPMAAAGVGIGLVWTARRWKWIVPPLLGAVLVVAWIATLQRAEHYWSIQSWDTHGGERHLEAAAYIDARSNPGDLVVLTGRGWNPATLYYAQRWGLMIEGQPVQALGKALGPLLPQLRASGYTLLFDCPPSADCEATYDLTTDPPRRLP